MTVSGAVIARVYAVYLINVVTIVDYVQLDYIGRPFYNIRVTVCCNFFVFITRVVPYISCKNSVIVLVFQLQKNPKYTFCRKFNAEYQL